MPTAHGHATHAERQTPEHIYPLLERYNLVVSIEKPTWSKDRYAKYAVIAPAQNVPEAVVNECVATDKATFDKGFRDRRRNAFWFNMTSSYPIFIEYLTKYDEGRFPEPYF